MAKTLLTTRTQVRSFLDESATKAVDWSDTELNLLINTYYHQVRTAAITTYEDLYLTTATFNSTANREEYGSTDGLPTNIFKIRRVEMNYDTTITSGAPTRCIPIPNFDAVRRDLGYTNAGIGLNTQTGAFYYSYGFGSNFKIGFIPIPDKNGTNAGKIWYIPEAADLSSDSSTLDIPYADKYWLLVAWGATNDALRFGGQESEDADRFERKYQQGVLLMQEELEGKIAEESKNIIDTSGDYLNFDDRH